MTSRPLRLQFVLTSLPVGGAETLLLNLVRKLDRQNFSAEVTCLKEPGELGQAMSAEVPVHSRFLRSKWDARVLWKLTQHFRNCQSDAVITVGAGDKMFWGRLAAKLAGVPVICSALHSTGWPDGVGKLNRWLTPITNGFIAVANEHAKFMREFERFPAERVFMIPNGVDTDRFVPNEAMRAWLRQALNVDASANLVGIVAAFRPEKNHLQFIQAAEKLTKIHPNTHFVIVGDGPERSAIETAIAETAIPKHFHLLGSRSDTERIVAGLDVFCLTSRNEANPVSILEALACGIPVVSPNVGSIHETVIPNQTGFLTEPLCSEDTYRCISQLLQDSALARQLGRNGRSLVTEQWSLQAMVDGYQNLIEQLYNLAAANKAMEIWTRRAPEPALSPANVASLPILPNLNLTENSVALPDSMAT